MARIKYTVVGEFIDQDTRKPSRLELLVDAANMALKDTDSPIRLTAWGSTDDAAYLQAGARAESMLLDWITDAEIGEFLFGILSSIDASRETLEQELGAGNLLRGPLGEAWQGLSEARRDLATHLRWLMQIAERHGRPPLCESDAELIAE